MSSARTQTGSDNWQTPIALVSAIERKLGVELWDDVAASETACVVGRMGRPSEWRPEGIPCDHPPGWDGLANPWPTPDLGFHDAIWCNPPYSTAAKWLAKCAQEGKRSWVVALVPARTDTAAWHDHVMPHAKVILYLRGRIQFELPEAEAAERRAQGAPASSGSTFPSAVILWHPGAYRGCVHESWDWRSDLPKEK